MFTNISWTTYLIFIVILLAAWYLVIGLRFYLSELQVFLSGKSKTVSQLASKKSGLAMQDNQIVESQEEFIDLNKEQSDDLFEKVEILSAKLEDAVSDASAKKYNNEEFSFLLQLILKEYPELKGSVFQVPINNLIESECEKQGFIRLSAVELEMLWIEV